MDRLTENKIILVQRKTRLDELIARFNTIEQARFYIEHLGADFSDYLKEHEQYKRVIFQAIEIINQIGCLQLIDRAFLPNFIFGKDDIIIIIGQDGLVANTMKYLSSQSIIGVNPDLSRWDGVLLPFCVDDLRKVILEVLENRRSVQEVSIAKVTLNDSQVLYAVNDLFIGQKTHTSARYQLRFGGKREDQSSSGIIVSTGLGSTGWFRSVIAGAVGITRSALNQEPTLINEKSFRWDSDYLYFSVREPFPSKISSTELVFGKVTRGNPLSIISLMPENGVIFSDGVESDFLEFRSGVEAQITVAEKKGRMVV